MLYEKALLLAKIETTFRQDASPDETNDALLVEDPKVNLDINQLERKNVRVDLSPLPTVAGRKVAKLSFMHEVRNNGNLLGTLSPKVGRLLRACGMAETQVTGLASIVTPVADADNIGTVTWTKSVAYAGHLPRAVVVEVTTAGGTGVAKVSVTAPANGELTAYSQTDIFVTDTVAIDLPGSAKIIPDLDGGSLSVGDKWTVALVPPGYEYTPISAAFESVTLYAYFDGLLHKMTGCRGTWSVEGTGGDYAKFSFEFTGDYVPVADAVMPTSPTYETTKPVAVELANLMVGGSADFACSKFSVDMANDVQIRDNINASNAYAGAIIVGRAPKVSFDPEAVLEASHPFWGNLSSGAELTFGVKVGAAKGNTVQFDAPNVQYTGLGYGNRNSQRTYDVSANVARQNGNDEVKVSFR